MNCKQQLIKMTNHLDQYIEKQPGFIGQEIFGFIIPDPSLVTFVSTYSNYETAVIDNKTVQNKKGIFLSRIPKKNGKHRYYLSHETVTHSYCTGCGNEKCYSDYCGRTVYDYGFVSKYIGKDLHNALFELFSETTK